MSLPIQLLCSEPAITVNDAKGVVVDQDYEFNADMAGCPRGAKVQLLGAGFVAVYAIYTGDPFWIGWAPMPNIPSSLKP